MNKKLSIRVELKAQRAVDSLNAVMMKVLEEYPEATWYLEDEGNLHLMSGKSHDGPKYEPQKQRILASFDLKLASGGGW